MLKTVLKEIQHNQKIENLIDEFIQRDSIATFDHRFDPHSQDFDYNLYAEHE
jgi:hypothetical protein